MTGQVGAAMDEEKGGDKEKAGCFHPAVLARYGIAAD
jgi:hypothetical protein